jgi:hypothetical protein
MQRTSFEYIQVNIKNSVYFLFLSLSLFSKATVIPFNRRMDKIESFSLLLKMYVLCMSKDRRRQDGDGRTDEEKNVHVWRVVLSYDSYLLTTEKTFLLFRRVSLALCLFLSCSLACSPPCMCPLLFSPAKERESKHCLLAYSRARARLLLLSLCVSPSLTTRLLLLLLHITSSSHHHLCFLLLRRRIFCLQHFYK